MGTNCAGRHECEPPWYPTGLGETWTCPDCQRERISFDVMEMPEKFRRNVPAGTFGWRTKALSTV